MNTQEVIEGFGKVLKELGAVQESKVKEYGINRYRETDPKRAMMMVYNDVYRKYIRLENQTFDAIVSGKQELDLAAIRESCRDLASYGGMGVQMVDLLKREPVDHPITPGYTVEIIPAVNSNPPIPPALVGIEQIALVNPEGGAGLMLALGALGAMHWDIDTVRTKARVWGGPVVDQIAELRFNYQLIPGKELELIHYSSGDNWLGKASVGSGLSHMGLHVDDIDGMTKVLEESANGEIGIAQDAVTISHTNPKIKDTRRYRYRIFNTRRWLGFDLKLITRHIIAPGSKYIDWGSPWMRIEL